jgi:hypothetical protein
MGKQLRGKQQPPTLRALHRMLGTWHPCVGEISTRL